MSKDEYIGGNIVYVPFTVLGNRVLIFGFHLSPTDEFTFLYQHDQPMLPISRHINNLPGSLDYFKQRLQAQNNRRIIYSWVNQLDDSTTMVGIPFDFDASLPDRIKKALDREKFSTISRSRLIAKRDMIRSHLLKLPRRGGEIYPELLMVNIEKSMLTVEDIPTIYAFRNWHQVQLPLSISFEVRYVPHIYRTNSFGSFDRVHIMLVNPEALRVLVTTFDDSRMSFIGGTRMASETILEAAIRECREESRNLIELTEPELLTAKYYYCSEIRHVVVVLYTDRDFNRLVYDYKLPLSEKKENYGFRSIRIQDFLTLSLGSFGPNVLSFINWSRMTKLD